MLNQEQNSDKEQFFAINETISQSRPIVLTPNSWLIFPEQTGDWRELLFDLSANRAELTEPTYRFWRSLADELLAALCRLPEDVSGSAMMVQPPSDKLEAMCDGAPPMPGGEYLSPFSLVIIWNYLAQWVAVAAKPSLSDFLAERAPSWQKVGRVTFHLAENKGDEDRPFAFMATYVQSLTAEGRDRHIPLAQALMQYAGQGDHPALLSLLTPVKSASQKLPWVAQLTESKAIFRPMAFTIDMAHRLLQDIPILEESGLTVRIPDWWKKRPQVKIRVDIGNTQAVFGANTLLDWDVAMAVGDHRLSEEEIAEILRGDGDMVFFKGQWLEVDRERLKEALEHWQTAKMESGESGLTFIKAMRLLAGLPAVGDEFDDLPDPGPWVSPHAGPALEAILREIRNPKAAEPPEELKAVLRPYQKEGLAWLTLLSRLGLGACLADDMGLGKTMQVLALLLLHKKTEPGPSLLVAPASLLSNWRSEAARFAPSLRLSIWHPSETPKDSLSYWQKHWDALIARSDLVIVSYALLARNAELFAKHDWNMVILDEAQTIKNPNTAQTRAVKQMPARSRLVLTGTPIENKLTDLWSLFDFLNPGLLGSLRRFGEVVSLLDSDSKGDRYAPIRRLVAPYLLRRLKTDRRIINDLPDKTETTLHCHLTSSQAKLYAQVVNEMRKALEDFDESDKNKSRFARSGLVLQSLMRLKQLINHPAQLTGDGDWNPQRSGKFLRLEELCREMAERQDKLLVFTQFKEIIPALFEHLAGVFGRQGLVLHGSTPVAERKKLVAEFQTEGGPPYFILSLKAGGTGLNLTAAGQVIHFDRWWNPAVEDQATDRAYRIGQKKNVLVHKCVTSGTLEERLDDLLREKRGLASDILQGEEGLNLTNMDNEALLKLVSLDIDRAVL
ncbi:MAG: DEAD/DEAH box helicase [Deltaproteobacteria bacterium]|jgi:non-specific serine/threonine protein kinase|nr:DEAD/DEAH box helicase [Deltaproteobacteria bacterium]